MSLQNTTRGVEDLLYNLGTTLDRFKGVNGLQRLVTTGKLSLLSLFGEFERTRDEVYERRAAAVNETRRCLVQIADEFEGITSTTQKLVFKVDRLLETLKSFHHNCDLELDDRSSTENADAQQLLRDFEQMREKNAALKRSLNDFCGSAGTCAALTRSAIQQLEDVNAKTSADVADALTDFDRQRRRVQVKENDVTYALSKASSRQDAAVQFAEFNFLKESEALEGYGKSYIDCLAAAMSATTFALEQSSMTGWASSNVFFVQLALFFHDAAAGGKAIAANLLSVKNAQKVSRQLTDEKRDFLRSQRAAAAPESEGPEEAGVGEALYGAPPTTVTAGRAPAAPYEALPRPVQMHADPQSPFVSTAHPPQQSYTGQPSSPAVSRSVDLDDLFQ